MDAAKVLRRKEKSLSVASTGTLFLSSGASPGITTVVNLVSHDGPLSMRGFRTLLQRKMREGRVVFINKKVARALILILSALGLPHDAPVADAYPQELQQGDCNVRVMVLKSVTNYKLANMIRSRDRAGLTENLRLEISVAFN